MTVISKGKDKKEKTAVNLLPSGVSGIFKIYTWLFSEL